ncbi:MAG: hypothetical protein WA908_05450 [Pontixanthobacter sp.]
MRNSTYAGQRGLRDWNARMVRHIERGRRLAQPLTECEHCKNASDPGKRLELPATHTHL